MLNVEQVCMRYGRKEVVKNVSFDAASGELIAVIGENGAGKSTLMNIISGALSDYVGRIKLQGKTVRFSNPREAQEQGVVMVHQELSLVAELSIAENIFLGHEPLTRLGTVDFATMKKRAAELMAKLDFRATPDTLAKNLRVAEQQLVEIAKALAGNARVLILDEPTSALNEHESEKLFDILKNLQLQNICILYISHHMDEVFRLADRILVLRNGCLVADKNARDTTAADVIAEMIGSKQDEFFATPDLPQSQSIMTVENLWRRRSSGGNGRDILQNVSFDVKRGELLGIAGLMGAGRTELLEALAGACSSPWGGKITFFDQTIAPRTPAEAIALGIGFVTEDRRASGLIMKQGTDRNISLASLQRLSQLGWLNKVEEADLAKRAIEKMNIQVTSAGQLVSELSGGNQQKVILSKWLAAKPKLLLLDEPTRGVDVGAKAEIYSLLCAAAASGLSQIIVSSDLPELMSLCHRILVLHGGRVVAELDRDDFNQETIFRYASYGTDACDATAA